MTNEELNRTSQSEIDFKEVFYLCLSHWRWFVLSVGFVMVCAVLYLLRTQPTYSSSAAVLMADNANHSNMDFGLDLSMFQGSNKKNNVYNDIQLFKSPTLLQNVVKELDLQMNYTKTGLFRDKICYGSSLPAKVKFLELDDAEELEFKFDVRDDSTFTVRDFKYFGMDLVVDHVSGHFGDTIQSAVGAFVVVPTPFYSIEPKKVLDYLKDKSSVEEGEIKKSVQSFNVSRLNLFVVTDSYSRKLSVELADKMSTTINLGFKDSNAERAREVLSMLITVYNGQWLQSKNQITSSTSVFISDRLDVIERELGTVDRDISSFKSANLMPDLNQASTMAMQKSETLSTQISELNNELYIARYIKGYLTSEQHKNELLPVSTGMQNGALATQIGAYNEKLLRRNALVARSSERNPLVQTYDKELYETRNAIIVSVDQEIYALNTKIIDLRKTGDATVSSIKSSPTQAQYLLSVERQQKVKEALYLYLLQKREENELSQAFTAYNTQVVASPDEAVKVAPMPIKVGLVALFLGFLIPIGIIVYNMMSNTTLRGKDDLKTVTIPIIGEIPLYARSKKDLKPSLRKRIERILVKLHLMKKQDDGSSVPQIFVAHGKRDIINEAFRVTRTNIEFMTTNDDCCTILLTSFNPGSGKSFVTMNLAASMAIRGTKILVIDCDLRHGTTSSYVENANTGLSEYLAGKVSDPSQIIVSHPDFPNLEVIPIGTIPPNPSELLSGPSFEKLLQQLKKDYKLILLDCPPIDIVADTQIVAKYADRTLFLVRVGLMERTMVSELQNMYDNKRFPNMSLVLNGAQASGKYGYRYGYRYGYGYGYGYGSDGKSHSYYYGSN